MSESQRLKFIGGFSKCHGLCPRDSRVETGNFDTFSYELLFIVHGSVIVANAFSGLLFSYGLV